MDQQITFEDRCAKRFTLCGKLCNCL